MRIDMGVENKHTPITIVKRTDSQEQVENSDNKKIINKEVMQTDLKDSKDPKTLNADLKASEHDVIEAIEKANKHIKTYDRKLEFSIHEGTKQIMVKVINTEDDSIIREIPSEKILDMVAHMWEVAGILVDEKR